MLLFSDFLHKSSLPILIYLLARHAFALFERTTSLYIVHEVVRKEKWALSESQLSKWDPENYSIEYFEDNCSKPLENWIGYTYDGWMCRLF